MPDIAVTYLKTSELIPYEKNPRKNDSAREHAQRGNLKTAQKIARNWVIDSEEPLVDHRVKSGKYVGWRKKEPINR